MGSKSLLIIGGSGFFGKTILDYFRSCNSLKINKLIIFSRRAQNIKIDKVLKKKIKIVRISGDMLKIKRLPSADYVIYAVILNNYNRDLKALKNYLNLAIKYHLNSKILYVSSGAVYGFQSNKIKKFKSRKEYQNFVRKIKDKKFPSNARVPYERTKEWKGWGDFLGTDYVATKHRIYKSFNQAKQLVQSLNLNSQAEWFKFIKSKTFPNTVPVSIQNVYRMEWKGWPDFLGTSRKTRSEKG